MSQQIPLFIRPSVEVSELDEPYTITVAATFTTGKKASRLEVTGEPKKLDEEVEMTKDEEGSVTSIDAGIKTDGDPSKVSGHYMCVYVCVCHFCTTHLTMSH